MTSSCACIGNGFVGGSLTTVLHERGIDVYVYDKAGKYVPGAKEIQRPLWLNSKQLPVMGPTRPGSINDLIDYCESVKGFKNIYFVCVPTPMMETGAADLTIVERVLSELAEHEGERVAVIKSTVPPGSTEKWNKMFEGKLHVVHCPEFLTEANALNDMRNQSRIILGGPRPWVNAVKQLFQTVFPSVPIIKTSSTTSEMVKYFTNVHLAARVVLSCELAQICEALDKEGLNIDFDKIVEYAKYDSRLGNSHMSVPGQDGIPGARGHCFPKDLNALIAVAKHLNVKPVVMEAVWTKNLEVIPEEHRDWEQMIGRAVSKKS